MTEVSMEETTHLCKTKYAWLKNVRLGPVDCTWVSNPSHNLWYANLYKNLEYTLEFGEL